MGQVGSSERPDWPTAVVVGAGGLGMAVARRLGQGHRLIVADRDHDHVERECAALRGDGYDAVPAVCDVTVPADILALAQMAASRSSLRTLVNVVGLAPAAGDFRRIMAVNLVGAARVAEAFVEVLEPGGSAVFISSSAARLQTVPSAVLPLLEHPLHHDFLDLVAEVLGPNADANNAYICSKAGLNRLCQREAARWGAQGLRLVSLSPGLIATPQGAESYKHSSAKFELFEAIPLQRECSMLEISGVVAFLVSDQASYISGTDILVDGGLVAARHRLPSLA